MKVDRDSLWLQHRVPLTEAIKGSQTGVQQQAAPLILMTGGKICKQPQTGFKSQGRSNVILVPNVLGPVNDVTWRNQERY